MIDGKGHLIALSAKGLADFGVTQEDIASGKYLEERQSNEEWQRQERELPPNPTINASSIQVSGQQKALPPNWTTPIATTTSVNVNCGSTLHTGNAEFAVDIAVGI